MLARVAAPNATHWLHFIVIYAIGNSPLFAQIRETRSTSKGFSVFCSQLQLSRIGFVSPFRKLGRSALWTNGSVRCTKLGQRSGAWIKLLYEPEPEYVIGVYIPCARGFDAFLVGI